jgi:hypothetical protein
MVLLAVWEREPGVLPGAEFADTGEEKQRPSAKASQAADGRLRIRRMVAGSCRATICS